MEDDDNMFRFDYSPEFLLWYAWLVMGHWLIVNSGGFVLFLCSWILTGVSFQYVRALRPPGWLLQWHCGVRVSSNKKLVGFISAIPANIRIYDRYVLKPVHMCVCALQIVIEAGFLKITQYRTRVMELGKKRLLCKHEDLNLNLIPITHIKSQLLWYMPVILELG